MNHASMLPATRLLAQPCASEGASRQVDGLACPEKTGRGAAVPGIARADVPFQAEPGASRSFRPAFTTRPDPANRGWCRPNCLAFDLSPVMQYYPIMRFAGYGLQAIAPAGTNFFSNLFDMGRRPEAVSQAGDASRPRGEKTFMKGEATLFSTLAFASMTQEYSQLRNHGRLALAAEHGKPPEQVSDYDIITSANPLIASASQRLLAKYAVRLGAGFSFFFGLTPGLLANAANITAERTVFVKNNAYDTLVQLATDVQSNHLQGEHSVDAVVNELKRVMQHIQLDHRKLFITEPEMHAQDPLLHDIAQDLVDKKIGIDTLIGVIGGGVLIPHDPVQSRDNYAFIRTFGLEGMARKGMAKQEQQGQAGPVWPHETVSRAAIPREEAGKSPASHLGAQMQERQRLENRYSSHVMI